MKLTSKESVNYRKATGTHQCDNCGMYHRNHRCDLVRGAIQPNDVCDRWVKK